MRKDPRFFCNCLNIGHASLVKKNAIDTAIFTLTVISINEHYCAMLQNFWPPFLNRIAFFKFYFKIVNVSMFFNFEPSFIEKFFLKSGFSNFGHVTIFAKRKFALSAATLKRTIFFYRSFLLIYGCFRHINLIFVSKFLRENTQKWLTWVQVKNSHLGLKLRPWGL